MSHTTAAIGQAIHIIFAHKYSKVLIQGKYLLLRNWRDVVTLAFSDNCQKPIAVRVTGWGVSAMIHINLSCLC